MNPEVPDIATIAAEEVLRLIYGDDLAGCTVSLESVAAAIREPFGRQAIGDRELLDLYEKVAEAVDLLSTPPVPKPGAQPGDLLSLLGERLDSIHTITQKLRATTDAIKAQTTSPAEEP